MAYTGYERYEKENQRTFQRARNNKTRVMRNVQAQKMEHKRLQRENKAKVEKFINDAPDGADIQALPPKYQQGLTDFLQQGKEKYYEHSREIMDYDPGSEEYMYHKKGMQDVKNSFKTAKAQTDMFGSNKVDLGTDISRNSFSKGNDVNEMTLLTDIYTDKQDMVFNENGTIAFKNEEGQVTQFGDLPDYFNKDYKTSDAIQKLGTTIYKAGAPFNPATKLMYEHQLRSMIEQGGTETLYSLATDDFFNQGGLGIPEHILKDPNRRDEVEEMVLNSYMNVLESQANAGAVFKTKKSKKTKKEKEEQDDKEYYSEEINTWLDTELPNLPMSSTDDVLTAWEQSGVLGDFIMGDDGAGGFILKSRYGRGKYINVSTFPKTDHAKFLAILKRNGIK